MKIPTLVKKKKIIYATQITFSENESVAIYTDYLKRN